MSDNEMEYSHAHSRRIYTRTHLSYTCMYIYICVNVGVYVCVYYRNTHATLHVCVNCRETYVCISIYRYFTYLLYIEMEYTYTHLWCMYIRTHLSYANTITSLRVRVPCERKCFGKCTYVYIYICTYIYIYIHICIHHYRFDACIYIYILYSCSRQHVYAQLSDTCATHKYMWQHTRNQRPNVTSAWMQRVTIARLRDSIDTHVAVCCNMLQCVACATRHACSS